MKKVLIIQTAFIGDVILATSLIEKIHSFYKDIKIDFLLRKGNESLLIGNPNINNIIIWNKKGSKYIELLKTIMTVRKNKYDTVVNLQRFASTGLITIFSKSKRKIGFNKNPLSFLYNIKVKHEIDNNKHEIERNQKLIETITDTTAVKPKLYPSANDYNKVEKYITNHITISPTSVWFTKQFPAKKWIEFINDVPENYTIYLLGGKNDFEACENIINNSNHTGCKNLAGELSLLQSAALMKSAKMNYVNDSAPLHLCSAMNAPVCAIFCSTAPKFGFSPLSDTNTIVEIKENLVCKPCGIHGKRACKEVHFNCANMINISDLRNSLSLNNNFANLN